MTEGTGKRKVKKNQIVLLCQTPVRQISTTETALDVSTPLSIHAEKSHHVSQDDEPVSASQLLQQMLLSPSPSEASPMRRRSFFPSLRSHLGGNTNRRESGPWPVCFEPASCTFSLITRLRVFFSDRIYQLKIMHQLLTHVLMHCR